MNGGCDGGSTEKAFAAPADQNSSSVEDQSGDSSDDSVKTDEAAAAYPDPAAEPAADTQAVSEDPVDPPQAPDLQAPASYPEPGQ
jgi:hypothetical protein